MMMMMMMMRRRRRTTIIIVFFNFIMFIVFITKKTCSAAQVLSQDPCPGYFTEPNIIILVISLPVFVRMSPL